MKKIESIAVDKLIAHPANPNRMSEPAFKKLFRHIELTGNYEPIIVRRHRQKENCCEIINGHHRKKVLAQLGRKEADCIVWDVDDDETMVLLATLNRLGGGDDLEKKSELIKKLSVRFSTKELSGMLIESKKSIERLNDLTKSAYPPTLQSKVFLNAMTFFLTDDQKQTVEEILKTAIDPGLAGTKAQKRAWTLITILREAKR